MGWNPVTLRKRFFGHIFGSDAKPSHGHGMEYFIDVLGILSGAAFIVGCYCFQSPVPEVFAIGDWCFIGASLVNIAISSHTLLEQLHAFKASYPFKDSERDELKETLLFLMSGVLFALGCVFFMPGLTNTAEGDFIASSMGTWLCIVGSFMVVMAVFYNGMGFEADKCEHGINPDVAGLIVRFARIGMFLLLFGGVFFVVGSFMYRPVFGGRCPPESKDATCMVVRSYGTSLYLAGSYCFTAQAILTLIIGIMKHSAVEYYEISDKGGFTETSKLTDSITTSTGKKSAEASVASSGTP